MNLKKINFKLIILLFIFWILLTMNFEVINLVVGILVSIVVSILSFNLVLKDTELVYKFPELFILLRYFLKLFVEIYKSSFTHMLRIIKKDCNPIFVEVTLDLTDPFLIMLISNSITLTPGTITVDTDNNKLTVLAIKDHGDKGKSISNDVKDKFEKFLI